MNGAFVEGGSPLLLADVNVGRLAKWLRALGYDVLNAPHIHDQDLLALAHAQGRILLTRDRHLPQAPPVRRGLVRVLLVHSEHLDQQVQEVLTWPGLGPPRPFTRCIRCNTPLVAASPAEVHTHAPPYVQRTQREFRRCPSCGRLYWRGSHWRQMEHRLHALLHSVAPVQERL
ncbi:MAG: Mut7-C RNAse domain-containing protein [Dehalococcoidia bacterium]|nr:Mut7-C RNAse domain-containing protein [Dehalococcoidia bacterium]MDW8120325.1 Mut7-C RNAse domain-containing protein [Chloroflexota bacterium]